MFILGHTGIGSALVERVTKTDTRWYPWLLVGTLLPDFIDKPLYYGLVLITGRRGADLGLLTSTRTIGHTALLLLAVLVVGWLSRHRGIVLMALGMATHLLLDAGGDFLKPGFSLRGTPEYPSTLCAVFYPLLGWRFPVMPFQDVAGHVSSLRSPYVIAGELIGGVLLWRRWRRWRTSSARPPSP
ncbi:MAG TPA: metal-dependent hydrolase [Polyangia bacterium]|jgi:hypothetical protein|nr:metal-dependent hydrolase [Polyangia bacterium]